MVAFESDSLSKLCSADQIKLLDSIDHLRLQGINNYVSLPQIIVCGDQSSGKSSVLEAISGVAFPVKSNLCTRFPTELVLRRTPHVSASVSIVPHGSRSESEQKALRGFQEKLEGFGDLPDVMERAKLAMGISTHGKAFAKDILRVEITGPGHPHLTIVDLPGLIHSETKHQTASDVELIQDVVQGYMKEPRCIILAVISAKNDFANQVVLKLARAIDKTGHRTLGVITKPDTLVPGSPSETLYVSLARNQEVEFRLGWHVLRNMDSEKGVSTLTERDAQEVDFFREGAWTALPLASLGIAKLRGRLSKVLLGQIASELPSLIDEIDGKFTACHDQLEKLGEPRSSTEEQRMYLYHLSQSFQSLVKASVDGTYNDRFFVDAKTEPGYQRRIRAVVQNLNEDFASDISLRGHYREITEATESESPTVSIPLQSRHPKPTEPIKMARSEFITHIEHLMRRTRGRELPGIFNPMIISDLFLEQSKPWESIAREHVKTVCDSARCFLDLVVTHIADVSTAKSLQREICDPALNDLRKSLDEKIGEFLKPHQEGHPITYNHYFTEALESVRRESVEKATSRVLEAYFGVNISAQTYIGGTHYNLDDLVSKLTACHDREPDVDKFAAKEALDCMTAYYKVALKRFIDDVAIEVIEAKLVSTLHTILEPVCIFKMPDDQVSRIAGESEESRTQREQLTKQLGVLKKGLETCKRFVGLRIGGGEHQGDSQNV
ncbi:P-loop containing nucleoside triphosphate hydrolase protein [Lasiosphaeris hirsuta]|uniref:P-loop containing nucleoside triphosphate hydrolase protein n=1 Tax=Lasiosphaeris hirsuta TaxID=260670 RepID=A0AA40AP95_9PEZI|nr:P-loop containing nucleoside triphosphate hydrolase protein [Lasiosphaeris hirsuta]